MKRESRTLGRIMAAPVLLASDRRLALDKAGGRGGGENSFPRRLFVRGWTIFKMILQLILSDDMAPQSLIQELRTGVVFLNRNEEGHLLQVSLTLQLFNQGASNTFVLMFGQELYASQRNARLRPHHA
jgi:hypothetical protein